MLRKNKIAIILGLIITLLLPFCGLAQAQPSDIQGHWAQPQISDWVNKGLAQGYPDGSFKPDNTISRAEFIALTNHAFAFSANAASSFSDVTANDWFAGEIANSQAAGYINGYQDGTMRPNQVISRQEVATILANIAKLDTATNNATLNSFKDAGDILTWSQGAIAAVVAKDLMHGYPDQTFRAQNSISRAEAIISLNNLIDANIVTTQAAKVYDQADVFGPASGMETINGNVIISVAGVTLQNCKITGNLTLAQGVGEGNVSLKNVTVQGTTYINGGGANSINLENCTLPSVTITKAGVRVVASGSTSVSLVKLENGATLLETSVTGSGFGTVTLSEIIPAGTIICLSGSFDKVDIAAAGISVAAANANIVQMDVTEKADGCKISLDSSSKVNTLSLNAAVSFTGPGSINTAEINADGSSFSKKPDTIENPNNYSYSSSNTSNGSGNGSGTGSGDGGGVAPLNLVSSDPEDGETGVSRSITIKLTFDRGVVRDHWDTNQNCFTMEDKNGQEVDITVTRADNYTDDNEKRNIYVKPDSALTAGMRYILTISANLQANNDNTLGTEGTISFTVVPAPSGGGGSGTPAAPTFTSSEVTSTGDISVTFNKAMEDATALTGKEGQFTVQVDGTDDAVTGISLPDSVKIKLILTTKITAGQVVSVAYAKNADAAKQVNAADGGILESFAAQNVTNSLVPAIPAFVNSVITDTGDISITFNKAMEDAIALAGKQGQFAVQVDGIDNAVTELSLTDATKIKLVLTTKVILGQVVTVAYTKDADTAKQVKAADGSILEGFTPRIVANGTVPAPTFASSEITNKGDVSVTFDLNMADPAGKHAQFKVTIDSVDNVVSGLETTGTPNKIKLLLTNKMTSIGSHDVTVTYTKGADAASQIISAEGGILESFTQSYTQTLE